MKKSVLNENEFRKKIKRIYLEEKKNLITEKDTWLNTTLDIIGIFDPFGIADFTNGIIRITKGDYFFGFLSLISAVPYVGDLVAKPIMGISKASKLYVNVDKALELSKLGKTAEAAKLIDDAATGNKLMNNLVSKVGGWAEKIKSGLNAASFKGKTLGSIRMIQDWCDLFIQVAKKRKEIQNLAKVKAARILVDPQATTSILNGMKIMMDKGFLRNVKLSRLQGVSFLKPWSSGWMAKYVWPTTTLGVLYRNRDIVSLVRRTRFFWGMIDYLRNKLNIVLPANITPDLLPNYVSEKELDDAFQKYANSEEGKKLWDDDVNEATLPSLSNQQSRSDIEISQPLKNNTTFDTTNDPIIGFIDALLS